MSLRNHLNFISNSFERCVQLLKNENIISNILENVSHTEEEAVNDLSSKIYDSILLTIQNFQFPVSDDLLFTEDEVIDIATNELDQNANETDNFEISNESDNSGRLFKFWFNS